MKTSLKFASVLVVFALLLSACNKEKITPQDLAQKIYQKYTATRYLHFKINESYIYSGQKDTMHTPYQAWLVRDSKDTALGGICWIENYYRPYTIYYDGQALYIIYPTKKKIRKYFKVFEPLVDYGDWTDIFFHPQKLMTYLTQHPNLVRAYDSVYNGQNVYVLEITRKQQGYVQQIFERYFINPKTLAPIASQSIVTMKNSKLYVWLDFQDVSFKEFDVSQFKKKFTQYSKKWSVIPYDPSNPQGIADQMLKIGSQAPDIAGVNVFTNDTFDLKKYKGKVILLDFWYSHCPPCVRAIPNLAKLYAQWHDRGLEIFGLNSIDKPNDKFFKFLNHLGVNYPIIHTTSAVDLTYKIIAYPSMYVIDKEGKIAYIEVGFEPKRFEVLKAKVDELLQK